MSCMLAALKSGLEYLTGKPYDWEQLEKLTGYKPKHPAWTVRVWTTLAKQGFDIRMIEAFDYPAYEKQGTEYLTTFFSPEELAWQLKHSNILEIQPMIPGFLKTVDYEMHSPTLADIDKMLIDDYLVFVTVNSQALNDKPGFSSHAFLVHSKEGDVYIGHDSGPKTAEANRRVPAEKLYKAMGGDNNTSEVTGFKLKG